jgi:hypothetical protein
MIWNKAIGWDINSNPAQIIDIFRLGRCVEWNGMMWIAGGMPGSSCLFNSFDGMNWLPIINPKQNLSPTTIVNDVYDIHT